MTTSRHVVCSMATCVSVVTRTVATSTLTPSWTSLRRVRRRVPVTPHSTAVVPRSTLSTTSTVMTTIHYTSRRRNLHRPSNDLALASAISRLV